MAVKYGMKKFKQRNVLYTLITTILVCAIFLGMMGYLYTDAQADAYENLHVQTKQIKDDLILQLISDRENLTTMASFATKLYKDGEDYSLLFESFRSIGMIEDIGILTPENKLITKSGSSDVNGVISFDEEVSKGVYISGRIGDVTKSGYELIRSAVPIEVDRKTVGILYGAIKPDKLGERYKNMVESLDGQLFVYEKSSGDILIDSIHDELGNISFLESRKYNEGYSYEEFISTDKGFLSFVSAYTNENMHLHYSTIEEFDWMIAFARYDSQVFTQTHQIARIMFFTFLLLIFVISLYVFVLMANERLVNAVTECASDVRKELLETKDGQDNIEDALIEVCRFAKSRSALFFDTDGECYNYIVPEFEGVKLSDEQKQQLITELFRYASDFYKINGKAVNVFSLKADKHLVKTNESLYKLLEDGKIKSISFSATINNLNHITIMAVVNPKRGTRARMLAEKVSACFSMALYNKNHLNKTLLAATTDSLTGALNRVAYKNDLKIFDEERITDFSCVYVDVNELHLCNNKYGHAAGDEMLVYIANTLKEAFYGHRVYRMGGDEFLVFCQNAGQDEVKSGINFLNEQLKTRNYHVAVGMSYRTQNTNAEEMVREAEVRMYEAKAEYYQNKDAGNDSSSAIEYVHVKTGIREIDTMISVLEENYNGIYRVSLNTDKARRILMPAYLKYNENEDNFSNLFSKYVEDAVSSDYHRSVMSFLNYEALKHQLMDGKIPRISYKKNDGENVTLSVYKLCDTNEPVSDTLWVFAKA